MKAKTLSLVLFIVAMVVQLLAQVYEWQTLGMISKPVLMPTLIAYFLFSVEGKGKIGFYVILALFFSWLGDVFLMFQDVNAFYFILGLLGFLTAHVIYMIIFRKTNEEFEPKPFTHATGFLLIIYGVLLLMMLWSGLGSMKVPVIIYTVVILLMAFSALYRKAEGASLVLVGAFLFVTSDSLLAINKFSDPFIGAGFWIMATYILAQYMITAGMINYLNRKTVTADQSSE